MSCLFKTLNLVYYNISYLPLQLYKANKNGLEIQTLEKVDASRLEERVKRFGLNLTGNRVITQRQIDELYENFGIVSGNERHFRFDALHLSGIDGLSTKDLFQYLEDYKPLSLEWVDDISCKLFIVIITKFLKKTYYLHFDILVVCINAWLRKVKSVSFLDY